MTRVSLSEEVTRGGVPERRKTLPWSPRVTEGFRPSLWFRFSMVRFGRSVSQPVRSVYCVSPTKQGREVIDRCSYAVAVTYAWITSKVAETSTVAARCFSRSVASWLRVRIALTTDAQLLGSRFDGNGIVNLNFHKYQTTRIVYHGPNQVSTTFYQFRSYNVRIEKSRPGESGLPRLHIPNDTRTAALTLGAA